MNWWAHQGTARARTRRLAVMMAGAVVSTISMIYLLLVVLRLLFFALQGIIGFVSKLFGGDKVTLLARGDAHWFWWPVGFWCVLGFVVLVTGCFGIAEYRRLRKGTAHLLGRMGGVRIDSAPGSPQQRQLVNIVQEMAIASGLSVPSVYVLEGEPGINAVSIGFTPEDSAIALTSGSLDALSRDQLQAMVAHEMAHILNGDTRLNMIAVSLVYGLGGIFFTGIAFMFPEEGDNNFIVGLPVAVIGLLGAVAAKRVQVKICRQREYLADACAVQYTRYAPGLTEVLRAIESHPDKSRVRNAASRELAHMFFADCAKRRWFRLFRTHPKPNERMSRLAPLTASK